MRAILTRWQQRQNARNNFTAVVPYELEQQRAETKEFLDDLSTRDQRMVYANVTLLHMADTLEQLDADTETLLPSPCVTSPFSDTSRRTALTPPCPMACAPST